MAGVIPEEQKARGGNGKERSRVMLRSKVVIYHGREFEMPGLAAPVGAAALWPNPYATDALEVNGLAASPSTNPSAIGAGGRPQQQPRVLSPLPRTAVGEK